MMGVCLFSYPTRLRVGYVALQGEEKSAFAKLALLLLPRLSQKFIRTLVSMGVERRVFASDPRWVPSTEAKAIRVRAIKRSWGDIDRPVHLIVGSAKFRQVTAEIGLAPVVLGRRGHLNRHS